ncbi:putative histidine kinase [Nocardia nova SH22a]|uniref:histidine kinase n=1 Tax=Nocardia nova SH22a TaxID=1415166 RepID=W5T973_9NOCA|nr:HAMP domain-containing sensor histidine kinase [Nocardia nova]AHH15538.1 putative histidine kinase [Nocardia nova SH22a]
MRDAARPVGRRWALGNWDLRWKVTAVLAVPLLVAVVLGASRIASEFSDSSHLNQSVDHVEAIPAVTGLSGASATVAGEQMAAISPTQSLVQDADLTKLDGAIQTAKKAAGKLDGVPGARDALEQMLKGAQAVRDQGAKPSPNITDAINQEEAVRQNSVRTVEEIVSQVSDPGVENAKLRLVDALNTRAVEVSQVAAAAKFLTGDPKEGLHDFQIAANTERYMLGLLAKRLPDGDPTIAELNTLLDNRISMTSGPEAELGQVPVLDIRQSLMDSLAGYTKIVNASTGDITKQVDDLAGNARTGAIQYAVIVVLTILAALIFAVLVARAMIVPLRKLRLAALRVAEHDLGYEVSRLRDGASPEDVPLEPMPVHTEEEVGQLARAVDDIHGQALRLAADQASMRTQVNDMFETLARRSKSLVDHQLSLIEAMEYDEKDPRLLENLFRLDHLAARMRRNGDNLLILAGTRQRRSKSAPVEIADVLRAAISEVEDYERVKLGATPRGAVTEPAASDLAHLFAELLDNALRASPPETDVKFTFAQAHDQGLLIEVADRGIGMPPAEMAAINKRLESAAEVGADTARHMGLFVVGRLAERHGLNVRLRPTFDTARDPGVTVTVHVPKAIIVAPSGGSVSVPEQSGEQAALSAQRPAPAPSTPSSMQMRGVTRTPSGNMMVTVDPGVSGPIPVSPPADSSDDRTVRANGAASGGLPQRSPGTSVPGGLPQRQPGANGPTTRQPLADADTGLRGDATSRMSESGMPGLPQREPGANGPQAPKAQPTTSLPQRGGSTPPAPTSGLAANMLKRQPGAAGQPPRPGRPTGLPQRPPSGSGLPQRDSGSGLPPRDPGGLPQRGGPGLPQRAAGPSGDEQSAPTPPAREIGANGLPQRTPGTNGAPSKDGGLSPREPANGGLPQRESSNGNGSGLPQRGDATTRMPDPGPSGLPQRTRGANGVPGRDSAPTGLQRDSGAGLPQRDSGNGLPQRDAGGSLPQRDAGSGLPQRDAGSSLSGLGGLPQRDAGSGLGTPSGLPQRGARLPQQDAADGAPQQDSANGGLPQRGPAAGGLPQRRPGAGLPPRPEPTPGLSLPSRAAAQDVSSTEGANPEAAGGDTRERGRHSYRSNPEKTASFFQTRLQPAADAGPSEGGSPIFAEMMSAWLSDPDPDRSQVAASFESPGDEGWQAARRAVEVSSEKRTAAGLPQRDPGNRLVPGGVTGRADRTASRDPESIRSSLSRHQQGVRDGRAMGAMNLTGDKGDR